MPIRHAFVALLLCLMVCFPVAAAWGHAVVYPETVAPNSFERFVLRVPTEKEIPTVKVRLLIPENLQVFSLGGKAGWKYQMEKDSAGRYLGITWEGGEIQAGEFTDFEFVARAPKQPGHLVWKAFQTYKDGSVVSWVGPPDAREPASITRVQPPARPPSPLLAWAAMGLALVAVVLSAVALWKHV